MVTDLMGITDRQLSFVRRLLFVPDIIHLRPGIMAVARMPAVDTVADMVAVVRVGHADKEAVLQHKIPVR